jgi:hypothetical protein
MLKPIEAGCKVLILNTLEPKNNHLIGKVTDALFHVKSGDKFNSPQTGNSITYTSNLPAWVVSETYTCNIRGIRHYIISSHHLLRVDGEDFTDETYTEVLILDKEVFTQ